MLAEVQLDLPKLGKREYLQGGTIFNGMLTVCDQQLGRGWTDSAFISSFKLVHESRTNGKFILASSPIAGISAAATFTARVGTTDLVGYFLPEGRPTGREPYDEESYYRVVELGADFEGRFVLAAGPRDNFIRGVVGANKLLHQKARGFGGELTQIRFLYLRDLSGKCLADECPAYDLTVSNVMVQDRGAEIWTINRITFASPAGSSDFRICYVATKP